ncbi:MAG: AAA family ATPase, partial [Melioribacteraceae bacterium]
MFNFGEEIYGQHKAIETLRKIYDSQKIPHALLFYGYEGVGKHFTAVEFAKLLNYNPSEAKNAEALNKIGKLNEPFIKFVFPLPRGKGETNENSATEKLSPETIEEISTQIEKKSRNPYYSFTIEKANTIKINSIRDIKKFVSYNFDDIRYRIILISDAHKMNTESQNALLKNLEEPPPGIIFILNTPYKDQLLPTIVSRCWQINFSPLNQELIEKILIKYFEVSEFQARKVSSFVNGSVTEAINLINNDFDDLLNKTITILRYSLAGRYNTAITAMNEILSEKSPDSYKQIISLISNWFNDVNKNRFGKNENYPAEYLDTLIKFNEKFGEINLTNVAKNLNQLSNSTDKNVNLNLISLN